MIDFARITVGAGDGGNGSGSFQHIKGKRYGKAGGGDGGCGGDVYVEATNDLNTLEKYRYVKDYRAQNGANGFPNHRRGADGEDLRLKVPVGTVVKREALLRKIDDGLQMIDDRSKKEKSNNYNLESNVYDLVRDSERILVARGGEGGRGNAHLRDELGRRPKIGERGQVGELVSITLELKLLADVGLIGLPNAGKSTLLAALTKATPKIADYPFTTLEPNLGVLIVAATRIIIADIPGLIEGASRGRGLGDLFLRHIERTRILLHLIDISTTSDKWDDYQTIGNELKAYSGELAKKREIIVLTKIDLVDSRDVLTAVDLFRQKRKRVLAISAQTGEGLTELVSALARAVAR